MNAFITAPIIINHPPSASNMSVSVQKPANQSSIEINVVANDTDPDHHPLTIASVKAGKLGTTAGADARRVQMQARAHVRC